MPAASVAAGAAAPEQRSGVRCVACPCLNVQLSLVPPGAAAEGASREQQEDELEECVLEEQGIQVLLPQLTAREGLPASAPPSASASTSFTAASPSGTSLVLRCLGCSTSVYSVPRPALPAPARITGFAIGRSESPRPAAPAAAAPAPADAILRPVDGVVRLCSGLLDEAGIAAARQAPDYSTAFGMRVTSPATPLPAGAAQLRSPPRSAGGATSSRLAATQPFSLPATPSSLLISPPSSPGPASSSSLSIALEARALETLRSARARAEAAVYETLAREREKLAALEAHIVRDAEALLARARPEARVPTPRVASGGNGNVGVLMTRTASGSSEKNSTPRRDAYRARGVSPLPEPTLSSAAFERRRTPLADAGAAAMASGSAGSLSQSVSALSASFAMRGRDAPLTASPSDWMTKKRLRERYPEADHSALTSAATSAATSADTSTANSEDEDERGRARGRERTTRDQQAAQPPPPPSLLKSEKAGASVQLMQTPASGDGRTSRGEAWTINDAERDRPAPGARKERRFDAPAEPAAPQQQKSSSRATPLSPPLKSARKDKERVSESSTSSTPGTQAPEKKVAFVETPVEVHPPPPVEEPAPVNADEGKSAVFDIDEEIELDVEGDGADEPSTVSVGERALELDGSLDPDDADSPSRSSSPDEFNAPASMTAMHAGSFSALAAARQLGSSSAAGGSEKRELETEEPEFDPASLRLQLDGSVVLDTEALAERRSTSGAKPTQSRLGKTREETSIGFRVAVGEAEARLNGLLAPNVPSHRGLGRHTARKYALDEEDDGWAAWQTRVRTPSPAPDAALPLARSMPIGIVISPPGATTPVTMSARAPGTTTFRDETSGFDLEPKTSLPYREKQMTPSLRQALRRRDLGVAARSPLPVVVDEPESTSGESRGAPPPPQLAVSAPRDAAASVQRGFAPDKKTAEIPAPVASRAPAAPAAAAAVPSAHASSSGTSTPLGGRRSPRPPYVAPPPPPSASTVLVADPKQRPAPLQLFAGPPDDGKEYEEGEEEELEWEKVLRFQHRLERLKINRRTGWLHHRVRDPECIAAHMYRMALLAMLQPSDSLDIGRCVQLALVHDLAEAEVGDLTPLDGVSGAEKLRREREAMQYLVHDLLGGSRAALRIEALWEEYERRETKEARLVKDLDRFELCLQAVEYERSDHITDLQPFFTGSIAHIRNPLVRKWAAQLAQERQQLWAERGMDYAQPEVKEQGP